MLLEKEPCRSSHSKRLGAVAKWMKTEQVIFFTGVSSCSSKRLGSFWCSTLATQTLRLLGILPHRQVLWLFGLWPFSTIQTKIYLHKIVHCSNIMNFSIIPNHLEVLKQNIYDILRYIPPKIFDQTRQNNTKHLWHPSFTPFFGRNNPICQPEVLT